MTHHMSLYDAKNIVSLSFVLVQEPLANSLSDMFLIMGQKSWNPPRTDFAEPKVFRDNRMCTSVTYIHFRSSFIKRKAPIAFNEVTDRANIIFRQTCPWTLIKTPTRCTLFFFRCLQTRQQHNNLFDRPTQYVVHHNDQHIYIYIYIYIIFYTQPAANR